MTVDQILTNRKQMALSVIENARPDLAKMGLEVVTFNVQDIRDAIDAQGHNHGVIEAIGIEQEELVKKQAEIARAQAARDVACAKAYGRGCGGKQGVARRDGEHCQAGQRLFGWRLNRNANHDIIQT